MIMTEENACRLCGEKLDKKENDTLFYCIECVKKNMGDNRIL
jgi:predicted RNA-binding Zn-ribbon protein involved in translation (DUF1610 family)|tara:strand:- start:158 stop:283 length:126 start_codon:yes stop_codon:yes gene_type:complete